MSNPITVVKKENGEKLNVSFDDLFLIKKKDIGNDCAEITDLNIGVSMQCAAIRENGKITPVTLPLESILLYPDPSCLLMLFIEQDSESWIVGWDSQYLDFELSVAIPDERNTGNTSLDARVMVDTIEKVVWFYVGINYGEGADEHVDIYLDDKDGAIKVDDADYNDLVTKELVEKYIIENVDFTSKLNGVFQILKKSKSIISDPEMSEY